MIEILLKKADLQSIFTDLLISQDENVPIFFDPMIDFGNLGLELR